MSVYQQLKLKKQIEKINISIQNKYSKTYYYHEYLKNNNELRGNDIMKMMQLPMMTTPNILNYPAMNIQPAYGQQQSQQSQHLMTTLSSMQTPPMDMIPQLMALGKQQSSELIKKQQELIQQQQLQQLQQQEKLRQQQRQLEQQSQQLQQQLAATQQPFIQAAATITGGETISQFPMSQADYAGLMNATMMTTPSPSLMFDQQKQSYVKIPEQRISSSDSSSSSPSPNTNHYIQPKQQVIPPSFHHQPVHHVGSSPPMVNPPRFMSTPPPTTLSHPPPPPPVRPSTSQPPHHPLPPYSQQQQKISPTNHYRMGSANGFFMNS